jgi:hypothetical protein
VSFSFNRTKSSLIFASSTLTKISVSPSRILTFFTSPFFGNFGSRTTRRIRSPCVRIVVASVFHSIRQGAEVRHE